MDAIRKYGFYSYLLELISASGLIYAFVPLFLLDKIPPGALVPIHFNLKGNPDKWADGSQIVIYPLLAIVFYILLFVIECNYKRMNYPVKITPTNQERLYKTGVMLIRHLKPVLLLIFGYSGNVAFRMATGTLEQDAFTITLWLFCGLLLILFIFFMKMVSLRTK